LDAVLRACREEHPQLIVNAAAATDVDRCEREPAYASRANALGPRHLALAALEVGARLCHVSTDYVFSGERKEGAYNELDPPHPLSIYGRSKLEGERAVLRVLPRAVIVRTAWLFGAGGRNFVSHMAELLSERGQLTVVSDQWSSPTYAPDLAAWILENAERAAGGVYHVVNQGSPSYFDVARLTAKLLGLDEEHVSPQSSTALERAAPRPRRTPLESIALPAGGLPLLRGFDAAYRAYIEARTPSGGS
jgi:dTDP-4-dehydrorhamnose reductase